MKLTLEVKRTRCKAALVALEKFKGAMKKRGSQPIAEYQKRYAQTISEQELTKLYRELNRLCYWCVPAYLYGEIFN